MNKTTLENKGYPAKSADFVGRGGATERVDFGRLRPKEQSEVCTDEGSCGIYPPSPPITGRSRELAVKGA